MNWQFWRAKPQSNLTKAEQQELATLRLALQDNTRFLCFKTDSLDKFIKQLQDIRNSRADWFLTKFDNRERRRFGIVYLHGNEYDMQSKKQEMQRRLRELQSK